MYIYIRTHKVWGLAVPGRRGRRATCQTTRSSAPSRGPGQPAPHVFQIWSHNLRISEVTKTLNSTAWRRLSRAPPHASSLNRAEFEWLPMMYPKRHLPDIEPSSGSNVIWNRPSKEVGRFPQLARKRDHQLRPAALDSLRQKEEDSADNVP